MDFTEEDNEIYKKICSQPQLNIPGSIGISLSKEASEEILAEQIEFEKEYLELMIARPGQILITNISVPKGY